MFGLDINVVQKEIQQIQKNFENVVIKFDTMNKLLTDLTKELKRLNENLEKK